jgi:predicted hotdog family 3-hydroxylacyl-ACP dehydratase
VIELEELQTLIPHKGRMLLLSRVIDYVFNQSVRAEYDVTENCLFYDPLLKGVPSWVGFEFMAQAISALSGITDRARGEKPKIGFILGISSMRMEIPVFASGSSVEVRVNEIDCTDMIYSYEGEAFLEGKKVMEGKLMVMKIKGNRFEDFIKEQS